MDSTQATRLKLSMVIGFLTIALFTILGVTTAAAAEGNIVARAVLLVIFGAIAVILASYAIGYIILTVVGTEPKLEESSPTPTKKPVAKTRRRRTSTKKKPFTKEKRTSKKRKKSKR